MTHGEIVFERIVALVKELHSRGEIAPRVESPSRAAFATLLMEMPNRRESLLHIPPKSIEYIGS